jgi:hypothetical protein
MIEADGMLDAGFVTLPVCQERHTILDERLEKLESRTDSHESRLIKVETILENQARLVNDMAQIQRDEMKWARNEISAARVSANSNYFAIIRSLAYIVSTAVILTLGGKLTGVI